MTSILIGAWKLQECCLHFADGRPPLFPFGEKAHGMLTYSDSGHMQAVLSAQDRGEFSITNLESSHRAADWEKARCFDEYLSYSGQYWVEEDWVVHRVELALNPNLVGKEQRRRFSFGQNGELILEYSRSTAKGESTYRLIWTRAQPRRLG